MADEWQKHVKPHARQWRAISKAMRRLGIAAVQSGIATAEFARAVEGGLVPNAGPAATVSDDERIVPGWRVGETAPIVDPQVPPVAKPGPAIRKKKRG